MITQEQLDEWRKLADRAHEGPWMWRQCYELGRRVHWAIENPRSKAEGKIINHHLLLEYSHYKDGLTGQVVSEDPDLVFIAAARTAVPALLDEVERLIVARAEMSLSLAGALRRIRELEGMLETERSTDDTDNGYDTESEV